MQAASCEVCGFAAIISTTMLDRRPTSERYMRGPAADGVSPVGLAAVAAILHVVVFAGRMPVRSLHHEHGALPAWRMPTGGQAEPRRVTEKVPSKPIQPFCAGQLCLALGMAVIALAAWLHIMRINGAHGP